MTILRRDHSYILCYIARVHKIPLNCILDTEVILASELAMNDMSNYNFCSKTVNAEWMTIAILRVICERYDHKVSFEKFISTNLLDSLQIDKLYKSLLFKYKDIMPANIIPSPTCTLILGPDYSTRSKFREYLA
jgi:hypothetical protein